ncbi:MAG: hypothetical protein ACOVJ8_04360 [Sediminibacterium sp.]
MLKKLSSIILLSTLMISCSSNSPIEKADNPLDGGRYFIENYLKGDMKNAKNYVLINPENQAYLDSLSKHYFALDREGRQQLRLASIQINEVITVDSTATIINYQNSFDNIVYKIKVVPTKDGWKVDLKYTYGPKL